MRKISRSLPLFLLIIWLFALTTVPALAAEPRFQDVPLDAPFFEAVEYMADRGITVGTGENCFSPETPITVRQWSVMLCRAFDRMDALHDADDFGSACLTEAYRCGWLDESAMVEPDSRMCRGTLYESAFSAASLPVYDYALYSGKTEISVHDNCMRIGGELGLCPENADSTEIVSRGESAVLLYTLLTRELQITESPVLTAFPVQNNENVDMNDYLLELRRVPEPILQAFHCNGWTYAVDFQYLTDLSQKLDMTCIGATSYGKKYIYVSEASSTIHEFGHFLDYTLGSPSKNEGFYETENAAAATFLREYARTNCREYFADCFTYWIINRDNMEKMALFQKTAPKTYEYFEQLEVSGWLPSAGYRTPVASP